LLSAAAGRGWRLGGGDSLFVNLAAGGRIESGTIANGTLSAGARYFHRSSERRTFYASIAADFGSRLDADREFTLGGDVGLRGYPLGYQSGSGRMLLTLEQRFFTNWQPLNLFRVGGALFFDAGYAGGPNALQAPQLGLLKDVGFGLRFANSKSAIANVLHFDVAFPLDRAPSIDSVQFLIKTKRSF
jgi:outer membrane translocation and assembly module TamA